MRVAGAAPAKSVSGPTVQQREGSETIGDRKGVEERLSHSSADSPSYFQELTGAVIAERDRQTTAMTAVTGQQPMDQSPTELRSQGSQSLAQQLARSAIAERNRQAPVSGKSPPSEFRLRVLTFNILTAELDRGANAWAERRELFVATVQRCKPHVLCLQEALRSQLDDVLNSLQWFDAVGQGRDGGAKGEHCPILYDTRVVKLHSHGTFWLSDTPAVVSKSWQSRCADLHLGAAAAADWQSWQLRNASALSVQHASVAYSPVQRGTREEHQADPAEHNDSYSLCRCTPVLAACFRELAVWMPTPLQHLMLSYLQDAPPCGVLLTVISTSGEERSLTSWPRRRYATAGWRPKSASMQ